MIELGADIRREAARALAHVKGGFNQAVSRSLNRTIDSLKSAAARETKQRYFVSVGEVKKSFALRKSTLNSLNAELISRGRRKSLKDYKLTPKAAPKHRKRDYVKGAVKREGGLKPLPGAFLVKGRNGYRPVYRTGRGRYDLKGLASPAVPQIVKNEDTLKALEQDAEQVFNKRMTHEVLRLLGAVP
ncbi:MAG: phage tail protein [Synergistaceae bacterium]|nr:phage tail protein [Synergistaceae bacterium]